VAVESSEAGFLGVTEKRENGRRLYGTVEKEGGRGENDIKEGHMRAKKCMLSNVHKCV
jgi:hypothetical protein